MKSKVTAAIFGFVLALTLTSCPMHGGSGNNDGGRIVQVSAGGLHNVAIRADGSLWTWGGIYSGHGGITSFTPTVIRTPPTRIGRNTNWAYVSAGSWHTAAIRTDGSLWAWGAKFFRPSPFTWDIQYILNSNAPVRIGADTDWAYVSAGDAYTMAIRTDGSLWAWGWNWSWRLGDGTTEHRDSPVRIGSDYNWASVSAYRSHTAAIRTDGSLWAWGIKFFELINDSIFNSNTPVRIGNDYNWASVVAGRLRTAAIRTDGSLWAWGINDFGQFGDGTSIFYTTPIQIGDDKNWASVSIRQNHSLAIRTDGSLWGWGTNLGGQLGDGIMWDQSTPVQIVSDYNWAYVSTGDIHTLAIRADGSLWGWGNNQRGQLVYDGPTENRLSPILINP